MKIAFIALLFLIVVTPVVGHTPTAEYVSSEVLISNDTRLVLKFTFTEPRISREHGYDKFVLPLEGTTRSIGKPELPAVTRLICLPDNATYTYRILRTENYSESNYHIIPYTRGTDYESATFAYDTAFYDKDIWYPETPVKTGEPSIMRDINFASLTLHPVTYNPHRRIARITTEMVIELTFLPGKQNSKRIPYRKTISSAFDQVYRNYFINYGMMRDNARLEKGCYLIIVPDALYNNVLPLADWKNRKGNRAIVKKLSEVGNLNTQIRNYISNAYFTWPVPPEYVLLIGDIDLLPTFYGYDPRHGTYATDLDFGLLEGSDMFPEVFLGRISVDNTFELDVVVAKTLGYERTPYAPSTWLGKFLCVSGDDFTSQTETKIWVQEFVEEYGYTVDTLFARSGATAAAISNAINNGRAYINYRGGGWGYGWREPYYTTTDILANLANGWKLPVMVSINCGSGKFNWSGGECFGEVWIRAGSPITPKGGVAFIGATHWTYASRNNALDVGIYRAIFNDSLTTLGQAMNAGKLFMYMCYPELDTTKIEYAVYHILGDPELNLWTGIPQNIIVSHPSLIPCGNVGFDVLVKDNSNTPLKNALVCLVKDDEVYAYELSDDQGMCRFLINPATSGILSVTVSGLNLIPYEADVSVVSSSIYVGYKNCTIDDDNTGGSSGNGDGKINPGETIELPVVLNNYGTQTSYNVTALLRSLKPFASVTDSVENFGTIAAKDSATSSEDYDFVVSTGLHFGDSLGFSLFVTDNDSTWYSYVSLPIFSCNLTFQNFSFYDGVNGKPEPGDHGEIEITLKNTGDDSALNLTAVLATDDAYITITDSLGSFGSIAPGNSATNSADRFAISIYHGTYSGHTVLFTLRLTASTYYTDTVTFEITICPENNENPTGPDDYGYYAYDSNDTLYNEVPVYNWVELDPTYGGSGTLLPLGEDGTATLPLPFTFKYYGINYDSISICVNGWITVGNTHLGTYANWPIPDTYGPPAMIAPFWEDLSDSLPSPGHIYYKYESTSHWFIVEWSRIYHTYSDSIPHPADPETFEAILYDPAFYPTLTGDGEIVCQYKTIINPLSSTIGIENEDENIGIQYLYNGTYADGASHIDDGLALKFTTDPPVYTGIEESKTLVRSNRLQLSTYPNPFTHSTTLLLSLPERQCGEQRLEIFDICGRMVRTFPLSADHNSANTVLFWDGTDENGNPVGCGIFIIKLRYLNDVLTTKIVKLEFE